MTTFLLTRPGDDSQKMVGGLQALGFKVHISPLLTIEYLTPTLDFDGYQTLVVTSPKAVHFLPKKTPINIFCVGQGTAEKVRDVTGQAPVTASTVQELIGKILQVPAATLGKILYLRGETIKVDLASALREKGLTVADTLCYKAHAAPDFPLETREMLRQGVITYTALFSVHSAQIFKDLINKAQLGASLKNITCVAYSRDIYDALAPLPFKKVIICPAPTLDCFWKQIKSCV